MNNRFSLGNMDETISYDEEEIYNKKMIQTPIITPLNKKKPFWKRWISKVFKNKTPEENKK